MLINERIRDLREKANDMERQWLLNMNGWKSTCSTPGCYWMYEKEIGGKYYVVDQETAARIQTGLDYEADFAAHSEKYEGFN